VRPNITIEDKIELTDEEIEARWATILEFNKEMDKEARKFAKEHELDKKDTTFLKCLADYIDEIIDKRLE